MLLPSTVRRKFKRVQRVVRRRWSDKIVAGVDIGERIRIYDVVCPLRYDIVVRAEFLRAIASLEEASRNDVTPRHDLDALLEYPAARAYRTWFKEVNARRFHSHLLDDESEFQRAFLARVEGSRNLWRSMSSEGFDSRKPIKLKAGRTVREVNGKRPRASFFAGDGCHRIACLLVMEKQVLEPNEYQVEYRSELSPLDNTAVLLEHSLISMEQYLAFISQGYCDGRAISTPDEAVTYVKEHDPERAGELESTLAHDLIYLR